MYFGYDYLSADDDMYMTVPFDIKKYTGKVFAIPNSRTKWAVNRHLASFSRVELVDIMDKAVHTEIMIEWFLTHAREIHF